MDSSNSQEDNLKWINPIVQNDSVEYHALIFRNIWMVTDDFGQVLIYDKHSPIGNRNKSITDRLIPKYEKYGATKATLVPLLILPDSPSRYY